MSGLERAVFFDEEGRGRFREGGEEGVFFSDPASFPLLGSHNLRNAAMAAGLARVIGVGWEAMESGIGGFRPLAHRMEPVGEVQGVRFVNDSKATNPHASLAGLRGVGGDLIVIAGGLDKGLDMSEWADEVAQRASEVILIGAIQEKLAEMMSARGVDAERAETLEEAVERALKRSTPGSTVVLSPACSSYDMFRSFEHRGEAFAAAVDALQSTSRTIKT